MGEETGNDEKKSHEMTPQEDGTKVLLNDEPPKVLVVHEAKYVADPNGDAKIDIGASPAFSGLTKEELMKYSNDPFWVRVRWFLFILFWVGWLAMLILAVVIIIQAPGCKPPPELLWVEENTMVELDLKNLNTLTSEDLISKSNSLGASSVYFHDYISSSDFSEPNYKTTLVEDISKKNGMEVVTDLPSSIDSNNSLFGNVSASNLIHNDGTWNYENDELATFVFENIVNVWIDQGVKGFIMDKTDTEAKKKFKDTLNGLAKPVGGAVGSNFVETDNMIGTPTEFQPFVEDNSTDWAFYKYNPNHVAGSSISTENTRLLSMGLFMSPGTIVLQQFESASNTTSELIKFLSDMKSLAGVKFGTTEFANATTPDVIAFTRVYKGTPAYAVALNFGEGNETVTFEGMANIGATGTVEIQSQPVSNSYSTKEKVYLNEVDLHPYEGIILQFVADF